MCVAIDERFEEIISAAFVSDESAKMRPMGRPERDEELEPLEEGGPSAKMVPFGRPERDEELEPLTEPAGA